MSFWEMLLDAFIDSAKILPVLLAVYFLIEFLEYRNAFSFTQSKFLKGKYSPIFGSLFGCVPQCGFSVISSDLYTKGKMSIGALLAVFIATSDEAIPIMLSSKNGIEPLLLIIAIKLVYAIAIGYLSIALYRMIFKKSAIHDGENSDKLSADDSQPNEQQTAPSVADVSVQQTITEAKTQENVTNEHHDHDEHEKMAELDGCCKHHIESKHFNVVHPLVHSLKIFAFILLANVVIGAITLWVGEDKLTSALSSTYAFQPVVAVLIGLIPNCVSSVVLTKLFLAGGMSFGSVVAGLCVNAGLGLLVLFKQNKNWKENLFITLTLLLSGLAIGYALHFIPLF